MPRRATTGRPGFPRRCRHGDAPCDQVLSAQHTCSSASCTTTGARTTPPCSRSPTCRRRAGTWRSANLGDLAAARERVPVWIQLRLSPDGADQPRRPELGGRHRPAQSRRRHRSDRLRAAGLQPDRLHQQRRGRHHARRYREHLQHLECHEQGSGSHNFRFGVQAQLRKFDHLTEVPPRGTFAFNGQFSGNPVADFLLGYCSTCTGAFGSSRSTYNSSTVAPFIDDNWNVSRKMTLQLGLRWEYPCAVGRGERPRRRVRSGERQDRLSPGAGESAAAARSARDQPGRFYGPGSWRRI